jgi:hypothetical protein
MANPTLAASKAYSLLWSLITCCLSGVLASVIGFCLVYMTPGPFVFLEQLSFTACSIVSILFIWLYFFRQFGIKGKEQWNVCETPELTPEVKSDLTARSLRKAIPNRFWFLAAISTYIGISLVVVIVLRLGYLWCIPYTNELGLIFEDNPKNSGEQDPMQATCSQFNQTSREPVRHLGSSVTLFSIIHVALRDVLRGILLLSIAVISIAKALGWKDPRIRPCLKSFAYWSTSLVLWLVTYGYSLIFPIGYIYFITRTTSVERLEIVKFDSGFFWFTLVSQGLEALMLLFSPRKLLENILLTKGNPYFAGTFIAGSWLPLNWLWLFKNQIQKLLELICNSGYSNNVALSLILLIYSLWQDLVVAGLIRKIGLLASSFQVPVVSVIAFELYVFLLDNYQDILAIRAVRPSNCIASNASNSTISKTTDTNTTISNATDTNVTNQNTTNNGLSLSLFLFLILSNVMFSLRHLGIIHYAFKYVATKLNCSNRSGKIAPLDRVAENELEDKNDTEPKNVEESEEIITLQLHNERHSELSIIAGVVAACSQITFVSIQLFWHACPQSPQIPGYHPLEYTWTNHLNRSQVCIPYLKQKDSTEIIRELLPLCLFLMFNLLKIAQLFGE